ncbi:hypothetical protein GCM10010977_11220 [Citricoccus zhacaiensis]|uniref:Uncharacterized protein n=1 Tax=Citricoccus zhacaiensis TaxID=489142 RepID=A0ABQ2LVL2_9MICC|nr:hypothetical protein [Citricoccus zhacaiensis]GGO43332.1 hypothetical protein GCM10010977_11220 [Citricoccus zhacaiensis]
MTIDLAAREQAGRALYEQRMALLPGLGQPPAPAWEDLSDGERERWCRHTDGPVPGLGPTRTRPVTRTPGARADGVDGAPVDDATRARRA